MIFKCNIRESNTNLHLTSNQLFGSWKATTPLVGFAYLVNGVSLRGILTIGPMKQAILVKLRSAYFKKYHNRNVTFPCYGKIALWSWLKSAKTDK